MADAARAEDAEVEKAKEAVSEMVVEGVREDIGVGERKGRKRSGKAGKPNFATTGVRQKWDQCVGENGPTFLFSRCLHVACRTDKQYRKKIAPRASSQ